MRLWKSNLVNQCAACNAKLGNKIRWSWQAIKLLGIYGAMKLLKYIVEILLIAILAQYVWMDISNNDSMITDQIKADVIRYYRYINP